MHGISQSIQPSELEHLRAHYDSDALLALKVEASAATYPAHAPWLAAISRTFFGETALAPAQRELCLVAMLSYRAPTLSLAMHVYAALMEGASVAEICEAVGLSGCYGGLPTYIDAMATVRKTLTVMKQMAGEPEPHVKAVTLQLAAAFSMQIPEAQGEP